MSLTRKQEDLMTQFEKDSSKVVELIEQVKDHYQGANPSFTKEETPKVFSDIKHFIDYINDVHVLPGGITEFLDVLKSEDHETLRELFEEHPLLLTKTDFFERVDLKDLTAAAEKKTISEPSPFQFFSQRGPRAEQAANKPEVEPGKKGPEGP